ncbi:MAG: mannose-1-phosphate guanylyltransferase/mannose-6-phosphate isomerase [Candidatus Sedimenticola endophacoides]
MLIPVIMAGGYGTRLWPLSRRMLPKQFLPLADSRSMLQETFLRLEGLDTTTPIVLCNEDHRFLAAEQLREIGAGGGDILLEPVGRNTAPAIAVAALRALAADPEALLLVLAADHLIADTAAFHDAVARARELAGQGRLVTFGIVAHRPETGYGYIRCGAPVGGGFEVERFVEKPDRARAEHYLASGGYYWNSGMFLFQARRYLEELERLSPAILAACREALSRGRADLDFYRLDRDAFQACPSDSVDYAVMEKTEHAAMVPLDAGWNDIGSWSALWEIGTKDERGNSMHGDVLLFDTSNSLVRAESRLVTTIGVDDLVVIETKDAVLVAGKEQAQNVKQIVDSLRAATRPEDEYHCVVYRPWGHFDSVEEGSHFKVKRITVKPGARLSVQRHHHRAEHWIVVSGTARVTRGGETLILSENESTYIHVGEVHALENPGLIPLELIEVQTGSYLGEDDIVRLDDLYGREG